jgi:glutamate/tyrosine decarboxylase-like PLP-dependent enzyme
MPDFLNRDNQDIDRVLQSVLAEALQFLSGLDRRPAGATPPASFEATVLADEGVGAEATLALFKERYKPWLSGSAGPRYFGFVTGGTTPAALAGDWLTGVYDQNALGSNESAAPQLELETLALLRDLFGLPAEQCGTFVSGATMSNFVGLALGRQWAGQHSQVDVSQKGLWSVAPIKVFSATPHSSIYKALSMLGMGREAITRVACLPDREAIDVAALENLLQEQRGQACIVVGNAGTVNTVDFDDLAAIATLKQRYQFWLHIDAAFGGFAGCSPQYRHLVRGIDLADSITIDAHKWLNVPYDAAIQFTRHQDLQAKVFQNAAVYLGQEISPSNFVHLTPENSRRLRALPSWFTLTAYGKNGYSDLVERNCRLAHALGERIAASPVFELLAPVRLNGVCFTLKSEKAPVSLSKIQRFLTLLTAGGQVFLTPTVYKDQPALRVSITNWRTGENDLEIAWTALLQTAAELEL